MSAILEHVNVTVSDPVKTAALMEKLFGWRIRWQGSALGGGHTIHVGREDQYLAIYTRGAPFPQTNPSYTTKGGLNHIGIVVDDLDGVEKRVLAAGYETFSHGDYDPGRRFYFRDGDDIEFEIVSYAK